MKTSGQSRTGGANRSGTSFARAQSNLSGQDNLQSKAGALRQSFETERCEHNAKQLADAGKTESQRRNENAERQERRDSFMVKRQKPAPVLRPSPALAYGTDKAVFNAQWDAEAQSAKTAESKEERKAAFKKARSETGPDQTRVRDFNNRMHG
ncbi:MAG: hypothetical protein GKS00_22760 [Alphaproteobacteria bacterium]|nr:hypothetical protein [Alphaproteobacteria bacterium]